MHCSTAEVIDKQRLRHVAGPMQAVFGTEKMLDPRENPEINTDRNASYK